MKDQIRMPQQKRSLATRRRIIEAALHLFSEKGFHKTNSKEIAALANVAIGSFYAYFPNKKQLFLEVLKNYYEQINARMPAGDALDRKDLRGSLHSFVIDAMRAHAYCPEFQRELAIMQYTDPDVKQIADEQEKAALENTGQLLQKMQELVRTEDQEAAAFIVYTIVKGIIHEMAFSPPGIQEERVVGELINMLLRYLAKDGRQ